MPDGRNFCHIAEISIFPYPEFYSEYILHSSFFDIWPPSLRSFMGGAPMVRVQCIVTFRFRINSDAKTKVSTSLDSKRGGAPPKFWYQIWPKEWSYMIRMRWRTILKNHNHFLTPFWNQNDIISNFWLILAYFTAVSLFASRWRTRAPVYSKWREDAPLSKY